MFWAVVLGRISTCPQTDTQTLGLVGLRLRSQKVCGGVVVVKTKDLEALSSLS